MPNYKLLALDLDGTTLTEDKRVTSVTRKWINKAIDAGVIVIFATGRGLQTTEAIWDDLGIDAPMVLANGAEIWKSRGRLLERHFIKREDIRWLHEQAKNAGAGIWGYCDEGLINTISWTEEMFEKNWIKFGMSHDNLNEIEKLRRFLETRESLEITSSAPDNIEISGIGISKETGVRKVCEYLGITMNQVMAIGDNHNDMRLIQAAGLGVAMDNGDDEVKQLADVITASNEENGVAKAIEHYLLGEAYVVKD